MLLLRSRTLLASYLCLSCAVVEICLGAPSASPDNDNDNDHALARREEEAGAARQYKFQDPGVLGKERERKEKRERPNQRCWRATRDTPTATPLVVCFWRWDDPPLKFMQATLVG